MTAALYSRLPALGQSAVADHPSALLGTTPRCRWSMPAAILLHAAALVAAGMLVKPCRREPKPDPSYQIIFAAPPDAILMVPSAAIARAPAQLQADQLSAHLPAISQGPAAEAAPKRQWPQPAREPQAAQPAVAGTSSMYPRPAPAPATAAAAPGEIPRELLASLQAKIRQAVQAAMVYPASARMLRREGRAQIGFVFTDGAVSHISVVASSGLHILDDAALAAVQIAPMPRAPAEIGKRILPLRVWVTFGLRFG